MLRISSLSNLGVRIQAQVQRELASVRVRSGTTVQQGQARRPERQSATPHFGRDAFEGPRHRAPVDLGHGSPGRSPQSSPAHADHKARSDANADAVARQIAQRAATWRYDHSGGKSWQSTLGNENAFDRSKSGVCTDMALEAAQEFEKKGIDAKVAFGHTDRGNHAWVEYRDPNGGWKMFDPTAAACRNNPGAAITPRDNGCYHYGSVFQTYTPPPER